MKKLFYLLFICSLTILYGCKQESVKLTSDDPVEQIIQLAEGVEQYSSEWTDEQWEDAVGKLEKAVERMDESDDEYNNDIELREATSTIIEAEKPLDLKFRIMKIFTKRAAKEKDEDSDSFDEVEED